MTRTQALLSLAAPALALLIPSSAAAQVEDRDWSGPASAEYARHYDPHLITIFDGHVKRVKRFTPALGTSRGLLLEVALGDGTIRTVHLGPEWFISEMGFRFARRDHVTVTGARTLLHRRPVVIAAKVELGARTLGLRDTQGVPLWMGVRTALLPDI